MKYLRKYIRQIIREDAMGFVHDLAASKDEFGKKGQDFYGGDPEKSGGRAIKRAFNANADHKWLSTLDTIHWGDPYAMVDLIGKSKDELSTTMTLPNDEIVGFGRNTGLWVKGRITLAANDMDQMFTGHHSDYEPGEEWTEEEVHHRDRSSGRNKFPFISIYNPIK